MKRGTIILLILIGNFFASGQTALTSIRLCRQSTNIAAYKTLVGHSFFQCGFRDDFCTKELMYKALNMGISKNNDALTCNFNHYGYSQFGKLELQLGYAHCFGHKLSIALQGVYLLQHAMHYKSQHSFTVDISFAYQTTQNLLIAIDLYNPIRMRYGITGKEIIPMQFRVLANYQPSERISANIFCQKTLPGDFEIGLEFGYQPITSLVIMGNCSLRKCGIGIHIPWKRIVFSIQSDWYYRISLSPGSDILFIL